MRAIKLKGNNDLYTFLDDEDADFFNSWDLFHDGLGYAAGYPKGMSTGGKKKVARVVYYRMTGSVVPKNCQVDHIDRNKLNDTRNNLRLVTRSEQATNRAKMSGQKLSKFKGVTFDIKRNKWRARITKSGSVFNLGYFDSEEEAASAYDKASLISHGEFGYQNLEEVK